MDDREVVAAIAAGDPAGITMAYDKYAALLYGYCHWMLRRPAEATDALRDTFVIAATTLGEFPELPKLRPWLYSVARNECQRRLRTRPPTDDRDADAEVQQDTAGQQDTAAGLPFHDSVRAADETLQFSAISQHPKPAAPPADETLQFSAISQHPKPAAPPADETLQFSAIGQHAFAGDGLNGVNGDSNQAELRNLIRVTLAELLPHEREVVELNLRHEFYDGDLATVLGASWSQAHNLSSQARRNLEWALGATLAARTGRGECHPLDELLAGWGGQLNEQTRDLVSGHVDHCVTCASRRRATLRSAALSGLVPLAPLPKNQREQVLRLCSATNSDAVAYRKRVVWRAESIWFARFPRAIRRLGWDSEVAASIVVGLIWAAIAVGVALYLFVGYRPAHAQTARPSAHPTASRPAAATTTIPAPVSASAKPSPTITEPAVFVPPSVGPSAPSTVPSELPPSPQPSKSPSSQPSKSPSPTASNSPSPKPSASVTPSPSSSTSPSTSSNGTG
jgi:RNA polymerase sigma factor (sigma-70 family)